MEEFYKLLGIDENATDSQVKSAYIAMKNKYDPGSYEKEDLIRHAEEKTKEITRAFDEIMNSRRMARMKNGEPVVDDSGEYDSANQAKAPDDFSHIQQLIEADELDVAEESLDAMPQNLRTANWFYLKGLIFFKKGWLEEATEFFSASCKMDPKNITYKRALEQAVWQRSGNFGNPNSKDSYQSMTGCAPGCDLCNICGAFLCADCCFRCMGGNYTRC